MPHTSIELWVLSGLASLGGVSELLDNVMFLFLTNDLLKGVPFAATLLLLWAVPSTQNAEDERETVLHIWFACILSLAIARVIQGVYESPRPLMVPELAALYPPTFHTYRLDWNSFPSDHMALYFAIALGVYLVRRSWGIALIVWCVGGVGLARVYAGYHYPLDILSGMAVAATALMLVRQVRGWLHPLSSKMLRLAAHYPALSMATVFFLCFQVATVFNTVRELGEFGRIGMRMLRTASLL